KPIDLSDERPVDFAYYSHWLYTKRIIYKDDTSTSSRRLARLYVLGEKLMDQQFQAAIIDAMIEFVEEKRLLPSMHCIEIIYNGTTAESPARRLMVDIW
ncbi:hypothetical protein P153DRAFT_269394, partial [Dothidotthia symphoricarpi CBS 119687]